MTWGWNARKAKGIEVGGPVGTFARETKSWPNYDSAYLAKTLGATNPQSAENDRFDMTTINIPDGEARNVYLQHAVEDYKAEADECLKNEFIDWLQGDHEDNLKQSTYSSGHGRAKRVRKYVRYWQTHLRTIRRRFDHYGTAFRHLLSNRSHDTKIHPALRNTKRIKRGINHPGLYDW